MAGNKKKPFPTISNLYDREKEMSVLLQLGNRIQEEGTPIQICLVHGESGSGKTALCNRLEREIERSKSGVIFVRGKYEQYQDFSFPYSAIVQAFDRLGEILLEGAKTEKQREELIGSFQKSLSCEGSILAKLIPSFSQLVDTNKSESDDQRTETMELASERLAVAFRSFLRLACTPSRPLVLCVDDLQWTDPNSLDVLAGIVDDKETKNLLFLGSYRDEEESSITNFLKIMSQHQVNHIAVRNLDPSSVDVLVAELLGPEKCMNGLRELSMLVFTKTSGNAYFTLQFLRLLHKEGLIAYNWKNEQWEWDIEKLKSDTNIESIQYFVTKRLLMLPPRVQRVLKLAACLGFSSDSKLLETLDGMEALWHHERRRRSSTTSDEEQKFTEAELMDTYSSEHLWAPMIEHSSARFIGLLDRAINEELIQCVGSTVRFTHDRVQQCAYELIPEGEIRSLLHLRVGRHIFDVYSGSSEHDPNLLLLAAEQCNRGSACLNGDDERLSLVKLNLSASKAARKLAGVALVADFLQKAIGLIHESDWLGSSYDLVFEVFCLFAEVESARGKFDQSDWLGASILRHAKSPEDTVRAVAVKARSLGAKQEYLSALIQARKALLLLGVNMPPSGPIRLRMEIARLKRRLKNKTDADLLALKRMTDKNMLTAMGILQLGIIWGWNADIYFAFANYGNILAGTLHDEKEACRFAQVAKQIDGGKTPIPATTMAIHSYLSHLRLPVSASLEPFLSAYRVSLETGDLAIGSICLCCYNWLYKFCGLPLGYFAADLRKYLAEIKLCRQDFLLAFLLPDFQLALNLTGETTNAAIISWAAIQESHQFTYKTEAEQHPADLNRQYDQLFNAIVLGDTDMVEQTLINILARQPMYRRFDGSHFANQFFTFWDGLASVVMLRKKRNRTFSQFFSQSVKSLTRICEAGSINCVGMLQLLKAERKSLLNSNVEDVRRMYTDAIIQLSKTGFTHFGALANERAGEFMLQHNDTFWGEHYLSRAATLYHEWGASVKVAQLLRAHPSIQIERREDEAHCVSYSIRSRSRYDSAVDSYALVSNAFPNRRRS